MSEEVQSRVHIKPIRAPEHAKELLRGVATVLGLGWLWVMEIGRDAFFRVLDRFNIKPRLRHRASAFPPGRPRKHKVVAADR